MAEKLVGAAGEEEEEEEEEEELEVELGLPGDAEPSLFTSAAGGQPTWLHPMLPPDAAGGACGSCSEPMALLLQLYAPLEATDAYHRYLYLLACPKSDCHFSARLAFKLIRTQLPLVNPYWPTEDPGKHVAPRDAAPLCVVCSLRSSSRCGGCKRVAYCGVAHQRMHWNAGHRAYCTAVRSGAPLVGALVDAQVPWGFTYLPLRTEPEPEKAHADDQKAEDGDNEDELDEEEEAEEEKGDEDKTYGRVEKDPMFTAFAERISREPDQVLRYTRWQDEAVLWVSKEQPSPSIVVPCELCHAPRRAEFQVLPQLLHFLRIDPRSNIDWGTLVAYTCSASCSPASDAPYVTEVLYRQNFTRGAPPANSSSASTAPASATPP
jgi:pre-rRNA-processing protein TSR4